MTANRWASASRAPRASRSRSITGTQRPRPATFYEGNAFEGWEGGLIIASLAPGEVVRLDFNEEGLVVGEDAPAGENARVRDVEIADDGTVLFLIDSEAGAILRMSPKS